MPKIVTCTIAFFLLWVAAAPGRVRAQQESQAQPGVKWTEQQIRDAVAPVRAGRKLTPRSWPNGAKVAVCLSYDIDNEYLAWGRSARPEFGGPIRGRIRKGPCSC